MDERNEYWKTMYEELELQMKDMMSMTLELIECNGMEKQKTIEKVTKENNRLREELEKSKMAQMENIKLNKEIRRLKLLEHKFNVTYAGKFTLKYLALKSSIKEQIKK
ncbi:UNVERIFIED_ORG: PDZ domain-containing secreted protein [Bacillus sp. B2I3]|nr:PDZ domain-containing secreted protein [Bacillus sp. B2I3]